MTSNLRELDPGQLWVSEESLELVGVPLGARSTIVKLADGGLWLHSPIEPTPDLRRELDAIGPIRAIVAPMERHNAYPADWAHLHPEAKIFVSPGWSKSLPREPQVLGDDADALWSDDLQQVVVRGNLLTDEVAFFHASSRTLIVCDLIFNLPDDVPLHLKALAKGLGLPFHPSPSRLMWAATKDNKAMRASLSRILEWDFDRIILSHGEIVESGGREALRAGFDWLWQNG